MPVINCYIDGLNLYKRRLERSSFKWLNLRAMLEAEFPAHDIRRIRYFTAHVSPHFGRQGGADRQRMYLKAVKSVYGVSLHYGQIRADPAMQRAMWPKLVGADLVEVWDEHEKGSDVNLIAHLFADLKTDDFMDEAVVVTHDSDHADAIRLARATYGKPIGVLDPSEVRSKNLFAAATYYRNLSNGSLIQLPETVETSEGRSVTRPPEWR